MRWLIMLLLLTATLYAKPKASAGPSPDGLVRPSAEYMASPAAKEFNWKVAGGFAFLAIMAYFAFRYPHKEEKPTYVSKPDYDKMEEYARRNGIDWTRDDRPPGW